MTIRPVGGIRQHALGMLRPSKPQIEACLTPATSAPLRTFFDEDFVLFEGKLDSSQLTSEKQPRFSGDNEPLAVLVVEFRLRQFLFGLRSALARCEH
jgi:hypothetical protein